MRNLLLRIVVPGTVLLVSIVIWQQRKLIGYGIAQLKGQIHIVMEARPVDDVLQDPNFPDSLKRNLHRAGMIRRFAVNEIGLKDEGQYQTVFDQQGRPVLWVVTAAEPYALTPYTWQFPFLGELEYKGYFDEASARAEYQERKQSGLDVHLGTVGAWSTLGWFKDPLLSGMLDRSEGAFAELLMHEMAHATVFVKGNTEESENLATFIGEEGALRFLNYRYGAGSPQEHAYRNERDDEQRIGVFMHECGRQLDSLYSGFAPSLTGVEKQQRKEQLFCSFAKAFDALNLHNPQLYSRLRTRLADANNTVVLTYLRYRSGQDRYRQSLERKNGNLRAWIDSVSAVYN